MAKTVSPIMRAWFFWFLFVFAPAHAAPSAYCERSSDVVDLRFFGDPPSLLAAEMVEAVALGLETKQWRVNRNPSPAESSRARFVVELSMQVMDEPRRGETWRWVTLGGRVERLGPDQRSQCGVQGVNNATLTMAFVLIPESTEAERTQTLRLKARHGWEELAGRIDQLLRQP